MIGFLSDNLINYLTIISIPFLVIWSFIFSIPDSIQIFPYRLCLQIFCFVFTRDAMIKSSLWFLDSRLNMNFVYEADTLFILAILSFLNASLVYWTNKSTFGVNTKQKNLYLHTSISSNVMSGLVGALLIYLPVYLLRVTMQVKSNFPREMDLLLANLAICIFGNLIEELLFRSYLSAYFRSLDISTFRSIFYQGCSFSIFHFYLAYVVTNCGAAVLVFTLYEGVICAFTLKISMDCSLVHLLMEQPYFLLAFIFLNISNFVNMIHIASKKAMTWSI